MLHTAMGSTLFVEVGLDLENMSNFPSKSITDHKILKKLEPLQPVCLSTRRENNLQGENCTVR